MLPFWLVASTLVAINHGFAVAWISSSFSSSSSSRTISSSRLWQRTIEYKNNQQVRTFASNSCMLFTDRNSRNRYGYRLSLHLNNQGNDNDENNNNDEEEDEEVLYFDDFDFTVGSNSNNNNNNAPPDDLIRTSTSGGTSNVLQERIREVQQEQLRKDTQLLQNWKKGDWSVRGFSLDQHDALMEASSLLDDDDKQQPQQAPSSQPIYVSKVVADANHDNRIWVGRTNGSFAWIQIGSDHITNFRSKLVGKSVPSSSDEKKDDLFTIGSELVPSKDIMFSSPNNQESEDSVLPPSDPFEILCYVPPQGESTTAISTIVSIPDEDYILTTNHESGDIQQWQIMEDDNVVITPVQTYPNVHSDTIVALKVLVDTDTNTQLLFSASRDGSIALWNFHTSELLYQGQIIMLQDSEENNDDAVINEILNCADVDEETYTIHLGTASGYVLAYSIQDLLSTASSPYPEPNGRFLAHESGVTAIACGGQGSLARGSGTTKSSLLITGGAQDGVMKQWELLSMSTPDSNRLRFEAWPKLANQRLPKKAHVFLGHEPTREISNIVALMSQNKLLSSSQDGTIRIWDPTNGEELYRMDGFSQDLTMSLCLQGDMLITNGMNQFVCVHDFDMNPQDVYKEDTSKNGGWDDSAFDFDS